MDRTDDKMTSRLQLGRIVTALLLCAVFVPWQPLVHGFSESEAACTRHGDNCTCPLQCRREKHDHAEPAATPACHLTSITSESGSVTAPATRAARELAEHRENGRESLPSWKACAPSPDEAVFGLDRLYPPLEARVALADPGEDSVLGRSTSQPLFVARPPTTPPPRV